MSDPTKELRTFIEGLQTEAREARLHQESAEEERDRLAEEVRRLQRELELANQARTELREVTSERDSLVAAQEKQQMLLMDVRRKAEGSERQRAQFESQRDQAMRLYKDLRKEADQHVAARDEAVRQRDAALRQRALILKEQEEFAVRFAETQRQLVEAQKAIVEAQSGASKKADGEIQKQILNLRQARDSAAAQAAELKVQVGELEDTIANLTYDAELAEKAAKKAATEIEAMRAKAEEDADKLQMLETLQAEMAEIAEELTALRSQHAGLQGAKDQLAVQLREFRDMHEAMLIANTSQIESTTKERDVLRTRIQERETELAEVRAELAAAWAGAMQVTEPEIQRLTSEVETLRARAKEIDELVQRAEETSREREAMRLQVIELNAQLENARRDVKDIGAMLAEARLQLKLGKKNLAAATVTQATATAAVEKAEAETNATPAATRDASSPTARFQAMRAAYDAWMEQPEDSTALWNLAKDVAAFSGGCEAAGQQVLHRISAKLAALVESMLENPMVVSPGNRHTIGQAIDFLGGIEQVEDLDEARLVGASAYVVEDEEDVREMVCEALRSSGFIVDATEHPSAALAHLTGHCYDLILLDVRLPEIDGFELSGYIRGMEEHAATPIVFVTGTAGSDFESMSGADFVGKPFHPAELALRAMILVVKSQLEPA